MKTAVSLLVLLSLYSFQAKAQSCFNVAAGNDTTIACSQPCLDLKAKIPDIKTTDDYSVVPIPYNPLPFTSPAGNELTLLYEDDMFSETIDMPFTFCFYGQNYNKLSAGSNGVITFDVGTNAGTGESYVMSPGNKIFFAGGIPNSPAQYYAPRASIFLAYYDMDPRPDFSPRERKIEWRLEGNAPCRKMVISYYKVDNYHGETPGTGTCINNLCTMQVVLYEGTGLIDVFYEYKPACTGYQGGLSIAGLQNWDQNKAVTLPGKNGTVWVADHEAYRYVPNGASSLLNRVELYRNNTMIATGTTTSLGNGQLEALFSNICQPVDSMSYVVKAFYQQCDNLSIETEGSDTIIVYKKIDPVDVSFTNASCNGGIGTITVTNPVGPSFEYSVDGVLWQTSPVFNKPAGNYTVRVRVIGSTCGGASTAVITEPGLLTASATANAATCNGNDGAVIVTAGSGTPSYTYSFDNGLTYQPGNTYTGAPGLVNIKVKDANGCTTPASATITLNDQMLLDLGADTTICFGNSIILQPVTNPETNIYKWTPAAGLDNDAVKNPVAKPADTTRYFLTAQWGLCKRTDDILVKVLHKPVVYAGRDTTICYKTAAVLTGSASNVSGPVNFAWSPAAGVTPANAAIAIAKPDTTQLYTLTVTDNYGCNFSVTDDKLVTMQPPVPAFAGNDTIAVYGIPHQLFGSGGKNYVWSPSFPLDNLFAQNPKATLATDTRFTLLVTDAIGCSNTDDVLIKVYKGPAYYIPNAFTPNGDGLNDIFKAIPVGISYTQYFAVYNRFGEQVFLTNQWLKGWDGTIKGKKAPAGNYVWMIKGIDRDGKPVEMKGSVILIRD